MDSIPIPSHFHFYALGWEPHMQLPSSSVMVSLQQIDNEGPMHTVSSKLCFIVLISSVLIYNVDGVVWSDGVLRVGNKLVLTLVQPVNNCVKPVQCVVMLINQSVSLYKHTDFNFISSFSAFICCDSVAWFKLVQLFFWAFTMDFKK